jgi:hypothetical protein
VSICPASPHRIATYSGRNILREGRCSARRMRRRRRADGRRLPPPGDRGHDRSIPAGDQEPASARRMLVSDINLKRCDRDGKHVPRRCAYDQANFPAAAFGESRGRRVPAAMVPVRSGFPLHKAIASARRHRPSAVSGRNDCLQCGSVAARILSLLCGPQRTQYFTILEEITRSAKFKRIATSGYCRDAASSTDDRADPCRKRPMTMKKAAQRTTGRTIHLTAGFGDWASRSPAGVYPRAAPRAEPGAGVRPRPIPAARARSRLAFAPRRPSASTMSSAASWDRQTF